MSDDFKISADVEINLSKMDQSLNNAVAKAQNAGARIQNALNGGGGIGGGGHSSQSAFGPPISGGNGFAALPPGGGGGGGGGGFAGGGGFGPQGLALRTAGGFGGGGFGVGPGGPAGGGGGGGTPANALNFSVIAAILNAIKHEVIKQANNAIDTATTYSQTTLAGVNMVRSNQRGDFMDASGYLAQQEQAMRKVPIVGELAGRLTDMVRPSMRTTGTMIGGRIGGYISDLAADPASNYKTGQREEELGMKVLGGAFGGYRGRERQMDFEQNTVIPRELQRMRAEGSSTAYIAGYQNMANAELAQRRQENAVSRMNDMDSLKTAAVQSRMNAFGAPTLGKLASMKTSINNQRRIATAQGDTAMLSGLDNLESAQQLEIFMGGMGPAQGITPGTAALGAGAVRTGAMTGQDPRVIQHLSDISIRIGGAVPLVGRN